MCVLDNRISAGRLGDGDVGSSRRRGDKETNREVSSHRGSGGKKKAFSILSAVIPTTPAKRVGPLAHLPSASSSLYPCEHKKRELGADGEDNGDENFCCHLCLSVKRETKSYLEQCQ